MDLISVIVPVYKVEAYLDKCVQSIVDQTYSKLEIILVDDGSPDNCPAMCDVWAKKDSRVKVIHKPNGGVSEARNAGLAAATGDSVCFIDPDDYVSPLLIERLAQSLQIDGIAVCRFFRLSEKDHFVAEQLPENTFTMALHDITGFARIRGGLYCCGILFPLEMIMRSPGLGFDSNLRNLEDFAWMSMILGRVQNITFVDWDNPMYFYVNREGAITRQCVDTRWQAESWLHARKSIQKDAEKLRKSQGRYRLSIPKQSDRLCLKNFYAECFAGHMSLSEVKELGARPWLELVFFKAAFVARGVIKAHENCRLAKEK